MKARIKHTQQIIDVEWDIRGWIWDSPNGKRIFAEEELIFFDSDNIDWQSFRAETVKAFVAASITHGTELKSIDEVVDTCIYIADLLIDKLKEKRNGK